jgi:hypothetical protein
VHGHPVKGLAEQSVLGATPSIRFQFGNPNSLPLFWLDDVSVYAPTVFSGNRLFKFYQSKKLICSYSIANMVVNVHDRVLLPRTFWAGSVPLNGLPLKISDHALNNAAESE